MKVYMHSFLFVKNQRAYEILFDLHDTTQTFLFLRIQLTSEFNWIIFVAYLTIWRHACKKVILLLCFCQENWLVWWTCLVNSHYTNNSSFTIENLLRPCDVRLLCRLWPLQLYAFQGRAAHLCRDARHVQKFVGSLQTNTWFIVIRGIPTNANVLLEITGCTFRVPLRFYV